MRHAAASVTHSHTHNGREMFVQINLLGASDAISLLGVCLRDTLMAASCVKTPQLQLIVNAFMQ